MSSWSCPHAVVPFRLQHPYHLQRQLVKPYNLAYGVVAAGKQLVDYGLPYYAHLGRRFHVTVGKHVSVLDGQAANVQVVARHAVNRRRVIIVPVDILPRAAHVGRHSHHMLATRAYGLIVGHLERLHVFGTLPHAAAHVGTGHYHYHVRAHLRYLGAYALFRALPDGKHGNHRCHTYYDAEHRQEATHLVVA